MNRQSMSDAGYSMLGAGAWGWPRGMLWGGRWEGGSCLGMHVRIKDLKIKKKKNYKEKKRVRKWYTGISCTKSLLQFIVFVLLFTLSIPHLAG